ncbi:uncharacterized protein LOC143264509 isoform X1 [Megachile rotundata]|uniref:uncharacterized protein LOC143264509 isoform X1 n=1 Tax=Megachile rotundata TaxID=143995 RepID=UPI003FD312E6
MGQVEDRSGHMRAAAYCPLPNRALTPISPNSFNLVHFRHRALPSSDEDRLLGCNSATAGAMVNTRKVTKSQNKKGQHTEDRARNRSTDTAQMSSNVRKTFTQKCN